MAVSFHLLAVFFGCSIPISARTKAKIGGNRAEFDLARPKTEERVAVRCSIEDEAQLVLEKPATWSANQAAAVVATSTSRPRRPWSPLSTQ